MAGRTAAPESRRTPARHAPGIAISLGPEIQRQRVHLRTGLVGSTRHGSIHTFRQGSRIRNLFTNDLSELFGRLRGLQAAVEADRRLNAPMPEQPPDRFIVARSVLKINRGRRVSKLVHGDSKSCRLFYPLTKLRAECMRPLRLTVLARE